MQVTTADRLRQIMDERRLRQVDIIRLCEPYCEKYNLRLSKSDLSQFVHGKVTPGQWKISILSRALNVSEAWLKGYNVPRFRMPNNDPEERIAKIRAYGSDAEEKLINIFHALTDANQQSLINYADFIFQQQQRSTEEAASVS